MGSVVYRDRERDRFEDSRTSVSSSRRGGDGGYTTVKRYVVKGDDDGRSSYGGRGGRAERVEETRIVRREVDVEEPPRRAERERREEPRFAERELVIRRDREEEPRRENRRDDRPAEQELVIRTTTREREEPREREREVERYDDRRYDNYLSPDRRDFGDRDIQRYTRTMDYFGPPQPQTIVIKNEIIMPPERARGGDDLDVVRRSETDDSRSMVRREPSRDPPRGPRDEEFFYEKKVRERFDDDPRQRDDDYYERKSMRREISPHDSVSQVGRGNRDRDDYSDDSMVYVRNKVTEDEGFEEQDPHHRRHLAEGVIAGIGAAELLRHHKKEEGRETGGGIKRIGKDVGAGALGALAVEGISRARSRYRSKSRGGRDGSESGGSRRGGRSRSRGRDKSRSRSGSHSKLKTLGGLGLGAAAIAAAAVIASRSHKSKSRSPGAGGRRRSRSRGRRNSDDTSPLGDDARNPSHRNKRIAGAGVAGAALAGLIERQRSKSRGPGERSRSKIREGLPIVAAGLGSAVVAGLYERNQAKKETEAAERRARSRSRSRSRGRNSTTDPYYDGPTARNAAMSDPGLIEYGDGNVYGNNYGADYYGRPPPQDGYYNNEQNAVIPAAEGAAVYGAAREVRPSRSRSLSSGSSSSDGGRRRRRRNRKNRSGSRDQGRDAAAAVGGVAAASEYERKKQEKRDRKARRRQGQGQDGQYGQDPYANQYNPQQQPYTPTPPPAHDPYASQTGFYPQANQFPPPPGPMPTHFPPQNQTAAYSQGASYAPQDFPAPPGAAPPPQFNNNFAAGGNADPYAPHGRGADENVSAAHAFGNPFPNQSVPNGLSTPRASSPPPPPMINIQRPSVSYDSNPPKSNPFLPVPNPFSPPPFYQPYTASNAQSAPRARSQPPAHRKSVQFAAAPQFAGPAPVASSLDVHRDGPDHRTRDRGYEAGGDANSTHDSQSRQSEPSSARSQAPFVPTANASFSSSTSTLRPDTRNSSEPKRRHHRRRRSHEPISSSAAPDASNPATGGSSRAPPPEQPTSPAPSEDTIDLPERFDKYGRKKPEAGDDPAADKIDEILAGKGATGRLFGNFVDGLFGPEGRQKKGKAKR